MIARRGLVLALLAASLVAGTGCSRRASPGEVQAWNAEIRALEAEQDSLRARVAEIVAADPRIQALPKGDVVLSVPTAFLRNVIERVFTDVAGNATLSLGGIKAHVAKSVKKIVTIGNFVVDVDIHEVLAQLKPGQPRITFGNNVIAMALPVEVTRGSGKATVHFVWDGKNIADATCGDMDVTKHLTANVVPTTYVVSGRLVLEIRDNKVICSPVFPETRVNIRVRPTKESWASIDSLLAEKHGVCGWVLDKVDVPTLLKGVVEEKGFNVRLPINKIKPFVLPGGVSDTVRVGERSLAVSTRMNSIRIDSDAIWYAATVSLQSK